MTTRSREIEINNFVLDVLDEGITNSKGKPNVKYNVTGKNNLYDLRYIIV